MSLPSSRIFAGPAGLSSPFGSGMKMKFGSEQSQTPPQQTEIPEMLERLAAKRVFLVKWPAVSGSSRMTTRSFPSCPGGSHLGYEKFSTTQSRPRSSIVKAMGWTMSGSPAKSETLKPSGTVIFFGPSAAGVGASCGSATKARAAQNGNMGILRGFRIYIVPGRDGAENLCDSCHLPEARWREYRAPVIYSEEPMKPIDRRTFIGHSAAATLALGLPAAAQDKKDQGGPNIKPNPPPFVDQSKIDKAIEHGIKYLMANNAAHMQRFSHANRQMQHTELVLWTYVHADVKESEANFQALLKDMLERKLEATYCVALQAMILEEIQRVKYQTRIWQCGQFLVDNQSAEGYWSYGDPTIYAEDPPGTPTTGGQRKDVASGVGPAGKPKEMDSPLAAQPGMRQKPPVGKHLKVEKKRDGAATDQSNSQYAALGLGAC